MLCLLENYLLNFKESSLALRAWNQRLKSLTTSIPCQSSEPLFGCPETILWCEITNSTWVQQHRITVGQEAVPDEWQWRDWREKSLALNIPRKCCSGDRGVCSAAGSALWPASRAPSSLDMDKGVCYWERAEWWKHQPSRPGPHCTEPLQAQQSNGPSSRLHLLVTPASSHMERSERKLPREIQGWSK